jgi:hypothetical protein
MFRQSLPNILTEKDLSVVPHLDLSGTLCNVRRLTPAYVPPMTGKESLYFVAVAVVAFRIYAL